MNKKIIALLLCILLCLTCVPSCFAYDTIIIIPGLNTEVTTPVISGVVIIYPDNKSGITDASKSPKIITSNISNNVVAIEDPIVENIIADTPTSSNNTYTIDNVLAQEIFKLTNEERISYGLNTLSYSYDLQTAADIRAKEASELFSHTRPNGSHCDSVVKDIDYYVTGENLIMAGLGYNTASTMVKTWMNSEGHRANILLADFTKIAIGVYVKDNITYAVQIFMG